MKSTPATIVIWCCSNAQSVGFEIGLVAGLRLVLFFLLFTEEFLRLVATDLLKAKDYRKAIVMTKIGKIYLMTGTSRFLNPNLINCDIYVRSITSLHRK